MLVHTKQKQDFRNSKAWCSEGIPEALGVTDAGAAPVGVWFPAYSWTTGPKVIEKTLFTRFSEVGFSVYKTILFTDLHKLGVLL